MEHWLRTGDRQEFISSMRMVLKSLNLAHDNMEQWKWAVIALHKAVQRAMVQALRAGNDFRVMPVNLLSNATKFIERINNGRRLKWIHFLTYTKKFNLRK